MKPEATDADQPRDNQLDQQQQSDERPRRDQQQSDHQQERVLKPDIESVHRDLAFANSYRQEFIKSLILIAGALFAFSVSFRPDLRVVNLEGLFWVAWIGLGLSMLGGFAQLAAWERFYSSYQRFDHKDEHGQGVSYRALITSARRAALICQVLGFIVGVAALGSFTGSNLANFEKKIPTQPSASSPAQR